MKCTAKKWCPGLFQALEVDGRKGIRILTVYHMPTGKPTRKFATLYSGDYVKSGVVLNFCPFCGTNLDKIHKIVRDKK